MKGTEPVFDYFLSGNLVFYNFLSNITFIQDLILYILKDRPIKIAYNKTIKTNITEHNKRNKGVDYKV